MKKRIKHANCGGIVMLTTSAIMNGRKWAICGKCGRDGWVQEISQTLVGLIDIDEDEHSKLLAEATRLFDKPAIHRHVGSYYMNGREVYEPGCECKKCLKEKARLDKPWNRPPVGVKA